MLTQVLSKPSSSGAAAWGGIGGSLPDQDDLVTALGLRAALASANVFTAAQTISVNGAASTPALLGSGTIFTGGSGTTTKPYWLIEPSGATPSTGWSTYGTALGVNLDAAGSYPNYPMFFEGMVDGTPKLGMSADGRFFGNGFMFGSSRANASTNYNGIAEQGSGFSFVPNATYILTAYDDGLRFKSDKQLSFTAATSYAGTRDTGLCRGSAGVIKVTNGTTGYGAVDASAYKVSGTAGVSFSGVATNLTIVNGIVTAAS